jgi:hypothetical protein
VYLPIRHVCSIVAVGSKADECSQTAPKGRFRLSVLLLAWSRFLLLRILIALALAAQLKFA